MTKAKTRLAPDLKCSTMVFLKLNANFDSLLKINKNDHPSLLYNGSLQMRLAISAARGFSINLLAICELRGKILPSWHIDSWVSREEIGRLDMEIQNLDRPRFC